MKASSESFQPPLQQFPAHRKETGSAATDSSISASSSPVELLPNQGNNVSMIVQTEPWSAEEPVYISLTGNELLNLVGVMEDLLRNLDIRFGDRVLIYDYNTSLSTLVMSRVFAPGLQEGVSEKMGCRVICTDGLSELAARSAFVFNRWHPDVLLIRSDLVGPFRSSLDTSSLNESNSSLRTAVVLHSDVAPWPRNVQLGTGDFQRFLLYKMDTALFMSIIRRCGGLYYDPRFYDVVYKSGDDNGKKSALGKISVSPTFSQTRRYHDASLECESVQTICDCGEKHELRTGRPAL